MLKIDTWKIIETDFNPATNRKSESLFSLGNGYMGQRANFEERYSGDTLLGNYVAGIYYPDPTKVGWWKNGYPKYYARIVNIPNWIGIDIDVNNNSLDLAENKISEFKRILHMDKGYLERSFVAELANGNLIKVNSQRFLSLIDKKIGVIKYSITPLNFSGSLNITPYIDAAVKNENSNWNETFLQEISNEVAAGEAYVNTIVKRSEYKLCTGMCFEVIKNDKDVAIKPKLIRKNKYVANSIALKCKPNDVITVYKYGANVTSRDYEPELLPGVCKKLLQQAQKKGYENMLQEHTNAWAKIWEQQDIVIANDAKAQQAIRFNIFQLNQSYTGDDERLNIGPKGFTGEKYGATTQWDTETYCLPYYLSTAKPQIAKNLLLYRYKHLHAAIENARNLGFNNGAALYPMATVDGNECQNEWEITFEEIHRNGAIAYAIYNYVKYSGDKSYLIDYGLEVLIALARFWSQRVTFSVAKEQYVILGVTGPNEYENNVNNNWYTNNFAHWTLEYTLEVIEYVQQAATVKYEQLCDKLQFNKDEETKKWLDIIDNIYLSIDDKTGIILQQEDYLDKEQIIAQDLDPKKRPLNQHWSWDRILRSCFIKQADVLQGIFLFLDNYDQDTIKENFDFYEPRTVHESSLSPSIHAALAARIDYVDKAYDLFLRATRFDLDDYNNEVAGGCHITSMAGAWMALIYGFAGLWIKDDKLYFDPKIDPKWKFYCFKINFRGSILTIKISANKLEIMNTTTAKITVVVADEEYHIKKGTTGIKL